jgi:hypothetical protein
MKYFHAKRANDAKEFFTAFAMFAAFACDMGI